MKAKITKGKSFRGVLNYVFGGGIQKKDDRAEWIGGSLGSIEPTGLLKEFTEVRNTRPEILKPVWHCSLALSENEHLSNDEWDAVAKNFMRKMKFDLTTPYVAVRHNDTDYDHIHIVASKIPVVGKLWDDGRDVFRAIAATQELEKEYNLTQTPGYSSPKSARETYRERKKAERLGVAPPRIQLQELIEDAVADKPTAPQFAQRLEDAGVIVRANVASTGRMNGFSFELDGLAFKGSKLGKAYGWGGLQKRGVSYDADRDAAELERYRLPVEERPSRISEEPEELTPICIDDIEKLDQKAFKERQHQIDAQLQKHPYMSLSEAEQWVEFDRMWSANSEKRAVAQEQERQRIRERAEVLWAKVEAEREEEKERARRSATQSSDEKPEIDAEPEQLYQQQSEPTQPPPSALYEAIPQEPGQQQQWVENLCPKLADLLSHELVSEIKGRRRTIAWDEQQQRLTVRENKTEEVVLDAEWDEVEKRWKDNGSSLTMTDFEDISRGLEKWLVKREREREKRLVQRELER